MLPSDTTWLSCRCGCTPVSNMYDVRLCALRYDMAELQMRMRQYDKAEKTVLQAMDKIKAEDNTSLASLIMQAQLLKLLAKVTSTPSRPHPWRGWRATLFYRNEDKSLLLLCGTHSPASCGHFFVRFFFGISACFRGFLHTILRLHSCSEAHQLSVLFASQSLAAGAHLTPRPR